MWDCVGEGLTKGEYHIIGGRINDLAWDGDSARIIAVGDGKERFGHCITADSGNSVGEISGHSALINCVSIRQQRPLRASTGSDDTSLVFYHGAPFKFNTSFRKHTRFVYGVAFSPDGASLVSVGADKKIWLYDGKSGDVRCQLGEEEHKGSIFSVSWAQDSKRFVTASADQTVKIWDPEAGKAIQTWRMGEEGVISVPDHQVGVVWPHRRTDGLVISLSLSGDLNYLSEGTPKPQRTLQGHQKNVTCITASQTSTSHQSLFTGSSEGRICSWEIPEAIGETIGGSTHTNYISGITASQTGQVCSVGWDDTIRSIDPVAKTFLGVYSKTCGQPKGVSFTADSAVVATNKTIELFADGDVRKSVPTKFSSSAIAAKNKLVAVGGDDNALHIFTPSLDVVKEVPDTSSLITVLAFSPSGSFLAVGFSSGKITVFETKSWTPAITRWSSHTSRVMCIAWNQDSTHAVTGGFDANIFLWSVEKPGRRVGINHAHKDGVNGIVWVEKEKVVSVGGDAAVKIWKVDVQ